MISRLQAGNRSPLVPLKQISCVHLVRHVRELVAPAVGDDHVAAGLEGLQVVRDLGAEELRRVQRGLVDHHGHALGLHAHPAEHWCRIRTNNVIEQINREIRRRTWAVGTFPDGNSALTLVTARLKYIAEYEWGKRRYLDMSMLEEMDELKGKAEG